MAPLISETAELRVGGDTAAVVIGLCTHGLSAARALARHGVPVYAIKRNLGLPGARSRDIAGIFHVDDFTPAQLLPALAVLRRKLAGYREVVLLPINDRHVRMIGEHLDRVVPDYVLSWRDAADEVLRLQRKDAIEQQARDTGLNYPRTVVFDAAAIGRPPVDALRYPLILKPVQPMSSFKTLIADSPQRLDTLLRRHAADAPILVQEYIAGGDERLYFAALLLDRGRVVHAMAGRKRASHPPARGQTTIAETVDAPEVIELARRFFAPTRISGPASLELKRDDDGRYWVIEPTVGRGDFWLELCVAAGFNQPLMELQLATGRPVEAPPPLRPCAWYDTERDVLAYARSVLAARSLHPFGKRPVFPYAGHGDWRPLLRGLSVAARRLSGRLVETPRPAPASTF